MSSVCIRVHPLVHASTTAKHFLPSHSTTLSQPLSHSLVFFSKGFSTVRARFPAVFTSLILFQACAHSLFFFFSLLSILLYLALSVHHLPPIPAWHMVSKLVCKYLSWMQSTMTCQLSLSPLCASLSRSVTSLLGQMAGGFFIYLIFWKGRSVTNGAWLRILKTSCSHGLRSTFAIKGAPVTTSPGNSELLRSSVCLCRERSSNISVPPVSLKHNKTRFPQTSNTIFMKGCLWTLKRPLSWSTNVLQHF